MPRSHRPGVSALPLATRSGSAHCDGPLRLSVIRDKLGYVVVKLGHRLIEGGQPGPVGPRELCQVSVGNLTVTNDSLGGHVGVRDIIGPEFMPRIGAGAVEEVSCRAGRLAFTDEQSHQ